MQEDITEKSKIVACMKCKKCKIKNNRTYCELGYFDEPHVIVLYTPYNFGCLEYESKEGFNESQLDIPGLAWHIT